MWRKKQVASVIVAAAAVVAGVGVGEVLVLNDELHLVHFFLNYYFFFSTPQFLVVNVVWRGVRWVSAAVVGLVEKEILTTTPPTSCWKECCSFGPCCWKGKPNERNGGWKEKN